MKIKLQHGLIHLFRKNYDDFKSVNDIPLLTHLHKRIFGAIYYGDCHQPCHIQSHLKEFGYYPEYTTNQISQALQMLKKKNVVTFENGKWNLLDEGKIYEK